MENGAGKVSDAEGKRLYQDTKDKRGFIEIHCRRVLVDQVLVRASPRRDGVELEGEVASSYCGKPRSEGPSVSVVPLLNSKFESGSCFLEIVHLSEEPWVRRNQAQGLGHSSVSEAFAACA